MVGREPVVPGDLELVAAMDFIQSLDGYSATYTTFHELKKHPKQLHDVDLVWFHRPDTMDFSPEESDLKMIGLLQEYISGGGSMLLTLDGFRYLNLLGVESTIPSTRLKASIDEGYGRKLGFHAFREHPVFQGLHGGSYVYQPAKDMTVRVHGFFGDTIPEKGNVVAIDWDYIFFRENSKLIIEYTLGGGKVLAVGGYTYFSQPNGNRLQLDKFTTNTFAYLTGESENQPVFFWNYSIPKVVQCSEKEQNRDVMFAVIPESNNWDMPTHPIQFSPRPATDNYCEVAGERMVVMGRERGGIEEIWAHPFMAVRDYEAGVHLVGGRGELSDSVIWLKTLTPEIVIRPDCFIRYYRIGADYLKEIVAADPLNTSVVVHYEYHGADPIILEIRFTSNLRFMWPYPETAIGTLCYRWDADYHAYLIQDQSGDFNVLVGATKAPSDHSVRKGDGFIIDAGLSYSLKPGEAMDLIISSGNEGVEKLQSEFDRAIRNPEQIFTNAREHVDNLLTTSVMITSPDKNFNLGYRWALVGIDRFFVTTPGMGSALIAGYGTTRRGWDGGQKVSGRPGYAWYFGRDGEWSGFALLDYGDFEKVKKNLEFYRKYQDLNGKIFHEATTSGVIHYDASDATPLYIVLAGKYFRHSGDTNFLKDHWPAIKKAINFCFSTDTDGDHLIENTGVGHGWVEGGELYGSHSSVYLTGCWAAALEEAATMASTAKDQEATNYWKEVKVLKDLIDRNFWNIKNGFYSYGLNLDGSFRTEPTILPSVPAYFGVTDKDKFRFVLNQYASNAFSTNWGTRIIREDSPMFKPTGYHYGSVWPLFTGWTALAEYRYGNYPQGFAHILNNLNVYKSWGLGYVEEVLNGAEYQPSGVCPHQCWSETMVIQPILEGMLGIEVFAEEHKIRLSPRLPADWDSLRVEHIRMSDQKLNFQFRRDSVSLKWNISSSGQGQITLEFMPELPPGTQIRQVLVNGKVFPFVSFRTPRYVSLQVHLRVQGKMTVEVQYAEGISVLPVIQDPKPGDRAEGLRIIDAQLRGNKYTIYLEGVAGSRDTLSVWSAGPVSQAENASYISRKNFITKFLVEFEAADEKYSRKRLVLTLHN
ncbi:MAG: GH116 family glycosyl hydrolase [bacterium]